MHLLDHVPLEDLVAEIHRRRRLIDRVEPPSRPETHHVLSAVAKVFSVSIDDLFASTRKNRIVEPRQCAMYLLRDIYGYTYAEAAGVFGLDHGTAMHACRGHEARVDTDPAYATKADQAARASRS